MGSTDARGEVMELDDQFRDVRLRYARSYVPIAEPPERSRRQRDVGRVPGTRPGNLFGIVHEYAERA